MVLRGSYVTVAQNALDHRIVLAKAVQIRRQVSTEAMPADQWMSHATDLVHCFINDSFPRSVVAHSGIFAWRDGRENPDTFQALLECPKGFLVSYSTSLGNDSPSSTRFMGKRATLMNIGGEGSVPFGA